jgi:hypothetical protein
MSVEPEDLLQYLGCRGQGTENRPMSVTLDELLQYLGACSGARSAWRGWTIEAAIAYLLYEVPRCHHADPGWAWMVRHMADLPMGICAELMDAIERVHERIAPDASFALQADMERLVADARLAFGLRELEQWYRWVNAVGARRSA